MKDAKENDINALITISNEFTSTIKQSPLKTLSKRQLSKVNLYHFSWRLILSTAMLLKNNDEIKDREKSLVLDELIRFLKDDSVGTKSFTQMPASWINVISSEQGFKKNDHEVIEIADALIEEFSEIAINLQDHLGVDCNVKLKSRFKGDRNAWQEDISKSIAEKKIADCFFSIPDAADDLILHIDLKGSKMSVGMEIKAPDERTTTKGKTNWLLNQLKKKSDDKPFDESNSFVQIRWKSKTTKTEVKLSELIEDKEKCFSDSNGTIASFTPMMRVHSTKIFKSRKKFIDELEKLVEGFYDHYGQYLKQPQPKAPKPIEASSYDIDLTSE
ncbi:MAG: hypothetical protein P8N97_07600 [Alphaproteobacteria bacterium]|nr:hypothetical protein [Alphaproteobacteria bacterium]